MNTVELLHELQTTDSALDAERERLVRVRTELADRSELVAARRERAARAATLQKLEADQRDLELEVDTLREQLTAIEKKLYGGRVGDAKELTNLNREGQQTRSLISTREDRLLQCFEATEQATTESSRADARAREVEAARRVLEAELAGERDRLVEAIAGHEGRQNALREQAESAALRTYDHLRKTRGGLAVAELRQRTCQGCRVSVPMGTEQRVRSGEALICCQSCGRILVPDPSR